MSTVNTKKKPSKKAKKSPSRKPIEGFVLPRQMSEEEECDLVLNGVPETKEFCVLLYLTDNGPGYELHYHIERLLRYQAWGADRVEDDQREAEYHRHWANLLASDWGLTTDQAIDLFKAVPEERDWHHRDVRKMYEAVFGKIMEVQQ